MRKIVPEDNIRNIYHRDSQNVNNNSNNKNAKRPKDTVDSIVDDVQAQIDKITQDTNNWANQLHNDAIEDVQLSRGSGGRTLLARPVRTKPLRMRVGRGNNGPETADDDDVRIFNNREDGEDDDYDDDESLEEVKLSHELLPNDKELAQKLMDKSSILQKQLDDYYRLVQQLRSKVRENESKYGDLESKFQILEEDKVTLEEELRRRPANNTGLVLAPHNNPLNGLNANKMKERDDLQKRSEELRKQLLFENDEEDVLVTFDDFLKGKNLLMLLQEFTSQLMPLRRDIRMVQARYGTSVASYFMFYRFLFFQGFVIALVEGVCLIFHINNMASRGVTYTASYSFSGQLPFAMALSSFSSDEALLYDFMVLAPLFILLVSICSKLISEDKIAKHLISLESENSRQYSKEVLASWDNGLASTNDVEEYAGTLANKFLLLLEETATAGKKKMRSQSQVLLINFKRFIGMLYYLLLVGASFSVIIYVTISSAQITASASQISFLKNFTPFIVTVILNFINGVTPTIITYLTEYEAWDSAQTIATINLFRLYVSNLLNALILTASYILLADPFLLASQRTIRSSVTVTLDTSFPCRFDQVGSGLLTLVVLTWLLDLFFFWSTPIAYRILEKYYPSKLSTNSNNKNNENENYKDNDIEERERDPERGEGKGNNNDNDKERAMSREGMIKRAIISQSRKKLTSSSGTRDKDNNKDNASGAVKKREGSEEDRVRSRISHDQETQLHWLDVDRTAFLPFALHPRAHHVLCWLQAREDGSEDAVFEALEAI